MDDYPVHLDDDHVQLALRHLGVENARPNQQLLEKLVQAYVRTVPWESASRIARRYRLIGQQPSPSLSVFPRWPAEFWESASQHGFGGTCFESNYAFFNLLLALGYEGYLTINNMGEMVGCHTAIVINLKERSWIVDVGLPLYVTLPISRKRLIRRESQFHQYVVRPAGSNSFTVERDRHSNSYCFTLVDVPVNDEDYRAATAADYGQNGLFLDRLIITKVSGKRIWRFNGGERPYRLERFQDGQRTNYVLSNGLENLGSTATTLARRFNMDDETIKLAFTALTR